MLLYENKILSVLIVLSLRAQEVDGGEVRRPARLNSRKLDPYCYFKQRGFRTCLSKSSHPFRVFLMFISSDLIRFIVLLIIIIFYCFHEKKGELCLTREKSAKINAITANRTPAASNLRYLLIGNDAFYH